MLKFWTVIVVILSSASAPAIAQDASPTPVITRGTSPTPTLAKDADPAIERLCAKVADDKERGQCLASLPKIEDDITEEAWGHFVKCADAEATLNRESIKSCFIRAMKTHRAANSPPPLTIEQICDKVPEEDERGVCVEQLPELQSMMGDVAWTIFVRCADAQESLDEEATRFCAEQGMKARAKAMGAPK